MTSEFDDPITDRVVMEPRILRATIGVEGVPFSQLRIYDGDDVNEQVLFAKFLAECYGDAFPQPAPVKNRAQSIADTLQGAPARSAPAQSVSGQPAGTPSAISTASPDEWSTG